MGILEKGKLYVFDIDRTFITTYNSDGELIWLKNMEGPYERVSDNVVVGSNGTKAVLHEGVEKVLKHLQDQGKNIAFLSVGGLLDVDYYDQPSVKIMKLFGIHSYFNHERLLLYKTARKDTVLQHLPPSIFFDDDEKHLVATLRLDNVTVVDRKSFTSWEQLL